MPVHPSLWESAIATVVHEARGLDVNPSTIERFRRAVDKESVGLSMPTRDGGLDSVKTFREEVNRAQVKGPFNVEDREKAGLTREFYKDLRGEAKEDNHNDEKVDLAKVVARLAVQYFQY
ncbi:hypothetical protein M378DRAFT_24942 [Amanita muscaria Koide BX008]|uniref:Uncharacterized protein n=1 Tax=Amanita muscaria (strain Koide BX008) TaxID=946122 RepID=A0A0C2X4S8_AMAMK|nr:hypothetical protein M378DRAFT_24942 [Amanita muscaria Koide BX008]